MVPVEPKTFTEETGAIEPKTFTEETGAIVHYHTGVFTGVKKGVMIGAGGLALIALVFVVLAQLNVLSIPPQGMYALYIAGGAIAAGDLIALVVLAIQHQRAKDPLEQQVKHAQFLADEAEGKFEQLDNYQLTSSRFSSEPIFYSYSIDKGQREFHLFSTAELQENYTERLAELHRERGNTVSEVTGAKVYYHTDAFTWPKVAALSGAGAIAVALSVIAILALLDVGSLGSLSSYGVYGLIAAGAIVTADLIAIAVIDIRAKAPMKKYVEQENPNWWSKQFKKLCTNDYRGYHNTKQGIWFTLVLNKGQSEIHFFSTKELSDSYDTYLVEKGFDSYD